MDKRKKKPFFKTKVGGILKGVAGIVAPSIVNALESVSSVPEALKVISDSDISEETKVTLRELTLKEYEIEVMDRTSAREREVKVLEAGGNNMLMNVLGWGCTLAFLAVACTGLGLIEIPSDINRDYLMFASGAIVSAFMTVLAYYFGSSAGSKQKTDLMKY